MEGKTSRYVLLCHMRAYSAWLQGDFNRAKEWAKKGVEIKQAGNLDTQYDSSHELALAQRDSGEVEPALKQFLRGESLDKVIDPGEYTPNRGGHFYGNVGRCLQLQGNLDGALICLRKSARVLEAGKDSDVLMNRGWAAQWLGEIPEKKGDFPMAWVAYTRASSKWQTISPIRSGQANAAAERVRSASVSSGRKLHSASDVDAVFVKWIEGS